MILSKRNLIASYFLTLFLGSFVLTTNAAPPQNDFWNGAAVIGGAYGTVDGTVEEATKQICEPDHVFPDEAGTAAKKSVWYAYQPPENGSYVFRITAANGFDSTLSAYVLAPANCNSNLIQLPVRIIENHNYNLNLGVGHSSQVQFRATAGQTVFISVDSYSGAEGSFQLAWEKARFKYSTQLDHNNSGTDLNIGRQMAGGSVEWWNARHGGSSVMNAYSVSTYGRFMQAKFLADFDGDGISEMVTIDDDTAKLVWWIAKANGQLVSVVQFGLATDRPIVGDYDGDGIADIAVTRSESNGKRTWHIRRSSDGQYQTQQFGNSNDTPFLGDYDGDGKTDLVVLRGMTSVYHWYIQRSSNGSVIFREFGKPGADIPQVADFDRDGATDITMFRYEAGDAFTGYWFSLDSFSPLPTDQVPTRFTQFGAADDWPQTGDYDGDGVSDLAIFRSMTGEWWIRGSRTGQAVVPSFGRFGDLPRADSGITMAFLGFNY